MKKIISISPFLNSDDRSEHNTTNSSILGIIDGFLRCPYEPQMLINETDGKTKECEFVSIKT